LTYTFDRYIAITLMIDSSKQRRKRSKSSIAEKQGRTVSMSLPGTWVAIVSLEGSSSASPISGEFPSKIDGEVMSTGEEGRGRRALRMDFSRPIEK
jgi:hypothetical protein